MQPWWASGLAIGVDVLQFLAMGGYAAFVWPAFGVSLVAMVGLFWQSWRLARRREAELELMRAKLRGARARPARPLIARRESADAAPGGEPA